MNIEFDPEKDAANIAKHGVSLARTIDFDPEVTVVDDRFEYGETRYRSFGMLDGLPHCLVFTTTDHAVRAISLRRAHLKEYRRYAP